MHAYASARAACFVTRKPWTTLTGYGGAPEVRETSRAVGVQVRGGWYKHKREGKDEEHESNVSVLQYGATSGVH
eukprot:1334242-Pleurochrysis_carterae.AAC.8